MSKGAGGVAAGAGPGAGAGAGSAVAAATSLASPHGVGGTPRISPSHGASESLAALVMCSQAGKPRIPDAAVGLDACRGQLAAAVVRSCFYEKKNILLSDATSHDSFSRDPFVASQTTLSVLCVPVFNKDAFVGVLYLHNTSLQGAFPQKFLRVLHILTTQMAVSLENAQAMHQLTQNNLELERLSNVKDRFLATTSHELRTPLNGILGTASLLEDTPLSSEQREYVETVVSSGQLLRSLLTDLIDLSKLQAGHMKLYPQPINFSAMLEHCVSVLTPLAHQKGLSMYLQDDTLAAGDASVPASPPKLLQWWVNADTARLQQIILNIINNAIKFTSSGFIELRARVCGDDEEATPSTDDDKAPANRRWFEIAIQDTGIGACGVVWCGPVGDAILPPTGCAAVCA